MANNYETFPYDLYPPEWGAALTRDRRVLVAPFGDGYEQVALDGINVDIDTFKVSWTKVPEAIATPVYTFLERHLKIQPFLFRIPAPVGVSTVLVMCQSLNLTYPENRYSISAELERKYYLGGFQ